MAARRIKDTATHLHWTFKKNTAQLRLARVTFEPAIWNGVCRLSNDVAYVRFFVDGRVGYAFELGAPYAFDLPSFLRPKAIAEIELRFQADLAARALGGEGPTIFTERNKPASEPTWVRVAAPCANCPPCVGERIKMYAGPTRAVLREWRKR